MVKNHLKRLVAPKTWKIERKKSVFITKPNPGPHSIKYGLPLKLAMVELLHIAKNGKEANVILNDGNILVDGVVRKDAHFIVGLFDVLTILKLNENYRVIINVKGTLEFLRINEDEAKIKPCKIIGKTKIGKKFQLNLYDSKNILTENNEYKVGDTVILTLPDFKIKEHLPFTSSKPIILIAGKHAGQTGVIEDIRGDNIIYKDKSGNSYQTLKKYAYILNDKN